MKNVKVVFHIDTDNTPVFELLIANIRNLLNSLGYKNVRVAVLANGYAVKHFVKKVNSKYYDILRMLSEKGVKILRL